MAYVINKTNGTQLVVLEDGTLDISTSIGLLGRNYTGYGEVQNENFIFLLENFANNNPPPRPLLGQTWFNTESLSLNVYDGTAWTSVGSATISETEPSRINGSLWFKEATKQLFVFNDPDWNLIGPEAAEGFGQTKARARLITDNFGNLQPVVEIVVNDAVIAICSETAFRISDDDAVTGFSQLEAGINLSSNKGIVGNLTGNASSATRLETGRRINGVTFTGLTDISVTAATPHPLTKGTYILGSNFNGSQPVTWSVDASPNNIIGKIVARDSSGDFSAGTITANLVGNVSGNVTINTGTSTFNRVVANEFLGATLSGNAFTATKLQTPRTINGISFDGSQNINIPVLASDLTGTRLAPNVVNSELTSLGLLTSLRVEDAGITVGNNSDITFKVESGSTPTLLVQNGLGLAVSIKDTKQASGLANFSFVSSDVALSLGGNNDPAFVGDTNSKCNIGLPTRTFGYVYSDFFVGVATSAQYADLAENYLADSEYAPGTVLEFGGEFEVTVAADGTRKVAGVVSTNPAYLMNSDLVGKHVVSLALQGRVPVKVRGKIKKGDFLVSGGNGYARPDQNPILGSIIGKALQDFEGTDGVIEVVVGRI
jgi:hypothetical protein